ncbi:MAG TPA: MBL fold metallo-hydrolase [Candidatus Acidoferrales bacterium]
MPSLELTVLGSGTSMGVPTIGCECRVCRSTDPHDKRTRPSLLLQWGEHSIVIDTTPDFRYQALRAGIRRLDAVVFTHGHADHILGLDDIRPFNLRQQDRVPIYASPETLDVLRSTFAYIFSGAPTLSTVPGVALHAIDGPFDLHGLRIEPVPAQHGDMQVLGFRFGRSAYLTDFSAIPGASKARLEGLDDLILDALRDTPHPMHSTVENSLALVRELKPRRAWFTHICHDLGHAETNARIRRLGFDNVELAYDGLSFPVRLSGDEEKRP